MTGSQGMGWAQKISVAHMVSYTCSQFAYCMRLGLSDEMKQDDIAYITPLQDLRAYVLRSSLIYI